MRVHTEKDPLCGGSYARGIFRANSTRHLVEGDDFWFGAAIYLPVGFYAAHYGYTDLLRLDSYVQDNGTSTPFAERAEINFASWSNDSLYVRAARGNNAVSLIGPISPTALPEGSWSWVEIHVHLSTAAGVAYTELKIDGRSIGSSRDPNLFPGAAPLNRLRYGIVSTDWNGSGDLTAYFDRASISPAERGPLGVSSGEPANPPPPTEPEPLPSLVSLWKLDELSGTEAADAAGIAPGTYVNSPTLGTEGLVGDLGSAVSFDGIDDHVQIASTPQIDRLGRELTVEAWIKAKVFRGSTVQRDDSFELRAQGEGSAALKLWIEGTLRTIAVPPETLSADATHQLVGTYDGVTMKLYLDGALVASRVQPGSISHEEATPIYIGRNARMDTYFKGTIDNVALYSEALGESAIRDRYAAARLAG